MVHGGGCWLLMLGGSVYYVLAGAACLASGILYWRGGRTAFLLYSALVAFTCLWAFHEVKLELWPLVPRILSPIAIWMLLAIHEYRRRGGRAWALAAAAGKDFGGYKRD